MSAESEGLGFCGGTWKRLAWKYEAVLIDLLLCQYKFNLTKQLNQWLIAFLGFHTQRVKRNLITKKICLSVTRLYPTNYVFMLALNK